MSQITVNNLTFSYDGSYDTIFDHVSFQIDTDWKLGFTGRNGRGKTTFLNLLLGKYQYSGIIKSSVTFEYFPYHIKDTERFTEEILEEVSSCKEIWRIKRELSLLGVEEDILYRPFCTLSNGEQTKALISALFLKENSFLLIDEPTNHLDIKGRELLSRYLKSKSGFILISHDRNFLDNTVDHILSINKTNIEIQKGNFSSWLANKENDDHFEMEENEKLKKDISRLSEAAKRTAKWSDQAEKSKFHTLNSGVKPDRGYLGHKAAKIMSRAKNYEERQEKAIDEKSKLLKNMEVSSPLIIKPLASGSSTVLEVKDLSVFYGENQICDHVSFNIKSGERIALRGKNGSGKSSILKLLLGEEILHEGTIYKTSNIVISYVSQDTSFLNGNLKDFAEKSSIDESLFKAILRKLDFSRNQFEKDMADFSMGQLKKVLIAKSLCESAHLYIWDEPLNFIDVISRIQIEELILKYSPTMLFVEHDKAFCDSVATGIVDLG